MDERKSPRLEGYDYSLGGYYFVTVCTRDRRPYLRKMGCDIQKGDGQTCYRRGAQCAPAPLPSLTRAGEIAERALLQIPAHYPGVAVDKYVVMPNHIHLILTLPCDGGRALRARYGVSDHPGVEGNCYQNTGHADLAKIFLRPYHL